MVAPNKGLSGAGEITDEQYEREERTGMMLFQIEFQSIAVAIFYSEHHHSDVP